MLPPSPDVYHRDTEAPYAARCAGPGCARRHAIRVHLSGIGTVKRCGYCLHRLRQVLAAAHYVMLAERAAPDPHGEMS